MDKDCWISFQAMNPQKAGKVNTYKIRFSQIEIIQGNVGEDHVWLRTKSGVWMRVCAGWTDFNLFMDTIWDNHVSDRLAEYDYLMFKAKFGNNG